MLGDSSLPLRLCESRARIAEPPIARDQWTYAKQYVTGWELPGDLPAEELAFFVAIPICGLLALEAVRRLLGDAAGA